MRTQIVADSPRVQTPQRRSGAVSWSEVLRALGRPVVRSYAVDRFRQQGFLAADSITLEQPWSNCRSAVCHALTATEDWLETEHPRWPERDTIRAVRRRLEEGLR